MARNEPPHLDLRCLQIQLYASLVVKEFNSIHVLVFKSLAVGAKTITVKMVESAGAISALILFHEQNETVSSAQVHNHSLNLRNTLTFRSKISCVNKSLEKNKKKKTCLKFISYQISTNILSWITQKKKNKKKQKQKTVILNMMKFSFSKSELFYLKLKVILNFENDSEPGP